MFIASFQQDISRSSVRHAKRRSCTGHDLRFYLLHAPLLFGIFILDASRLFILFIIISVSLTFVPCRYFSLFYANSWDPQQQQNADDNYYYFWLDAYCPMFHLSIGL